VASRLQAGRSGVRIPAEETDFLLQQTVQTASGAHPAYYYEAYSESKYRFAVKKIE